MNMAHAHLMLNHIPVIAVPVALIFLLHSLWTKNDPTKKFAYLVLIIAAATIIPVYFTGEPAEELVEHLPGISESRIESHEEAAGVSVGLTAMVGVAALFGLFASFRGWNEKIVGKLVLATVVIAFASLAYTANLGGKIRHTELQEPAETPQ